MAGSKPHLPGNCKPSFLARRKVVLHDAAMATEMWQRLRSARKYANKTQQQIAEACEISREAVSQWEASDPAKRTFPGMRNLQTVSRVTGAPIEWLLSDGSGLSIEEWLDAPTAPSTPALDPALLARAITEAAAGFRRARRLPTDELLAAAAVSFYQHLAAGRALTASRRALEEALRLAGPGEPVFPQE